jgi:hypothetical protein
MVYLRTPGGSRSPEDARRARIKWRIPGGNAVLEWARPRRGRGAAERRDRLCRKPGGRRSWDYELRYTLKNSGASVGVADGEAVPSLAVVAVKRDIARRAIFYFA